MEVVAWLDEPQSNPGVGPHVRGTCGRLYFFDSRDKHDYRCANNRGACSDHYRGSRRDNRAAQSRPDVAPASAAVSEE